MINLNPNQKQRYLRNIIIPQIGEDGQKKLLAAKILVIGAGGLGSSVILYLAANGIGNITIVDDDVVEISNLQRQIIHNSCDLDKSKVKSAKAKVKLLNDDVNIEVLNLRIDRDNLSKIINDFDCVIDCSDNFSTRFSINEVCFKNSQKLIFAAVKEFSGQLSFFNFAKKNQPCYSCFNHNDDTKNSDLPLEQKGILGSIPGILGSMQATLAINHILGIGEDLAGKMIICDLSKFNFRKISLSKNESCKICST